MRKVLSLILALILCLSLSACGNNGLNDTNNMEKPTANQHTHDWKAANCTKPKTCLTCGETEGNAAGHDWKAATCIKPKFCLTCGETEGNAAGHDWKAATCTRPKICRTCGDTEGSVASHSYEATKTVAPTCTSTGYIVFNCIYCGERDTEELAKIEHYYTAATCSSPKTCVTCGITTGQQLSHKDNGNGYCSHCSKHMLLAELEGKMCGRLIIPRVGTNNAWFEFEFTNNTDYWFTLQKIGFGNGYTCYAQLIGTGDHLLQPNYTFRIGYTRALMYQDKFEPQYYDMYLGNDSWACIIIKIHGPNTSDDSFKYKDTTVYIKANSKGETILGLSLKDVGM